MLLKKGWDVLLLYLLMQRTILDLASLCLLDSELTSEVLITEKRFISCKSIKLKKKESDDFYKPLEVINLSPPL